MQRSTFVWGIRASDGDGMMSGTGCDHNHSFYADAENCLATANRFAATNSREYLADTGIFHCDGTDLSVEENELVILGMQYEMTPAI